MRSCAGSIRSTFLLGVIIIGSSIPLSAQTTILPPPPGQLIVVNNGPGDQSDPHVSGNLVSYSNSDGTNFTVRYHDLSTGSDAVIPPNSGTFDFLADVSGNTIAFTRVSSSASAIFAYTLGAASAVEIDPKPGSSREASQIGTATIAWEEFTTGTNARIVAYDRATATVIPLTTDSALNQSPAISPDGHVIVWEKCQGPTSHCDIWSAVGGGSTWTTQPITQSNGNCSHPDTNGQVVVYSCNRGAGDHLFWQPVTGGAEQSFSSVLAQESFPSIAGEFVAFAGLAPNATTHDLYVFDIATSALYQITNTPADEQLNDISIMSDGRVNVVWQVQQADLNVYAFSFNVTPEQLLTNLGNLIDSFHLPHGITTSLDAKLQAAKAALASNDITTACDDLTAFINEVMAQSGKKLTVDEANQLIAAAQQIKAALGCS